MDEHIGKMIFFHWTYTQLLSGIQQKFDKQGNTFLHFLLDEKPELNCMSLIVHYCTNLFVAEPPKLLGPHAPVLVPKTSDGYACAPDNLTRSVRLPQGHRINHLQPEPRD
jgi:hypothetical protein